MITRLLLTACVVLLGVARVRAIDVVYIDPKSNQEYEVRGADLEESPEGIKINKAQTASEVTYPRVAGKTTRKTTLTRLTYPIQIPPANVKDYLPAADDVLPVDHITFRTPLAKIDIADANQTLTPEARMKQYVEALPLLEKLIPLVTEKVRAKRHVRYRHALLLTKMAGQDPTQYVAKATEALTQFAQDKDNMAGWQIAPVLTMLAALQEDTNVEPAEIQKTYDQLAAVPGVSEQVRVESLIKAAGILLKTEDTKKFAEARKRLQDLQTKLGEESPFKAKVQVYLAQCVVLGDDKNDAEKAVQQLRALLTTTDDKSLKALTHNTLGDYYRKLKQNDDAFWEYLRVDTMYTEDRAEHARAMYHLIQLFREEKKNADRSDAYLEDLTKNPRFAGLEYTKKALKK